MYKKSARAAIALSSVFFLIACASGTRQPVAGAAGGDALPYLVGPGDQLQIFVWDHPELTTTVQVRPDGRISTPLVEDLEAAGKSPTVLGRDIENTLKQYVRTPVVTVIVQAFVGQTEQQVRVVGHAAKPRVLQYRQGMTLLDVMIEVGGLADFASGNRARIVRNVNGQTSEIRVRLNDLLNDGKIDQNVRMLPGDVLIIPQSVF
jgi:polysaccharide export outer membrane protein